VLWHARLGGCTGPTQTASTAHPQIATARTSAGVASPWRLVRLVTVLLAMLTGSLRRTCTVAQNVRPLSGQRRAATECRIAGTTSFALVLAFCERTQKQSSATVPSARLRTKRLAAQTPTLAECIAALQATCPWTTLEAFIAPMRTASRSQATRKSVAHRRASAPASPARQATIIVKTPLPAHARGGPALARMSVTAVKRVHRAQTFSVAMA